MIDLKILDWQPLNIEFISFTLFVSNDDIFNYFKEINQMSISSILLTFDVLNNIKYMDIKEEIHKIL